MNNNKLFFFFLLCVGVTVCDVTSLVYATLIGKVNCNRYPSEQEKQNPDQYESLLPQDFFHMAL